MFSILLEAETIQLVFHSTDKEIEEMYVIFQPSYS